ncbi:MAG TPA: hypothetical protein VMZ03_02150 [Chitinophagaceae bacterium]|nr:hypothetical protein [Chitinophagaceae bacterium]
MKKVILAFAAFTAVYTVSAQETVVLEGRTASSYNAYSIPEPIIVQYKEVYGEPALATWSPVTGWWQATYKGGAENRLTHVYYSTQPYYLVDVPDRVVSYKVALPVINTFVSEDVIKEAITKYGDNLYSVKKLRTTDNADAYQVALIENGTMRTVLMNDPKVASN